MGDLFLAPTSLPLSGAIKYRAYNVLIKNKNLTSAKKLMYHLLQNKRSLWNVNTEVWYDSTCSQYKKQYDETNHDKIIKSPDIDFIIAMVQESFKGNILWH